MEKFRWFNDISRTEREKYHLHEDYPVNSIAGIEKYKYLLEKKIRKLQENYTAEK